MSKLQGTLQPLEPSTIGQVNQTGTYDNSFKIKFRKIASKKPEKKMLILTAKCSNLANSKRRSYIKKKIFDKM
jgi:hypothetical protein